MRVKWLHLSDIHFNYKNYDSSELREAFLDRIKRISEDEPFTHLFLTGDILFRNSELCEETVHFISDLISAIGIDKNHVMLVPGNHDHDREKTILNSGDIYKISDEQEKVHKSESLSTDTIKALLDSFEKFNNLYRSTFGTCYYCENDTAPHSFYTCEGVNILKLNTAWLDTESNAEGTLCFGSYQLQKLLASQKEALGNGITIALGHHPINALLPTERQRLLSMFSKNNIGLYFCGHNHKPDITYFYENDVLQITCPGGYVDNEGYSQGGYVWGVLDTDCDFYKAEVYSWNNGDWSIESKLPGTGENGIYQINTKRYQNNSKIVAVDLKAYNGHIDNKQLTRAIGTTNYRSLLFDLPVPFDWDSATKRIEDLSRSIESEIENGSMVHVFPLAQIPLLIKLGYELQNNYKMIIHQYDRDNGFWVYKKFLQESNINTTKELSDRDDLVVSISTSSVVDRNLINDAMSVSTYDYLDFRIDEIALGKPLYNDDVIKAAKTIEKSLNAIVSKYRSIHIFAAIPAGLAIELGRRMLKSIYSNIFLYQYNDKKYELAFVINPSKSSSTEEVIDNRSIGFSSFIYLPMVGKITCGPKTEPILENEEVFPIPSSLLGTGEHFVLRATGDSMIDAGIDDGDYLIVHQQETAENGQIIVALLDNETTLKRLIKDDGKKQLILHPENNKYEDIIVDDISVQGVVVKVIKDVK